MERPTSGEVRALIEQLLAAAHDSVKDENPSEALQLVLDAMTAMGFSTAEILVEFDRAKKDFDMRRSPAWSSASKKGKERVDSPSPDLEVSSWDPAMISNEDEPHRPLLQEQGREDVLVKLALDGSSTICPGCHGVISIKRAEAHFTLWCPALGSLEDEDD